MCLAQEHKSRSKNTKLKSKNHKPRNTNTNSATDLSCQPSTKATNTNPATDFLVNQSQKQQTQTQTSVRIQTQTQQSLFRKPAIHLQKTQKAQIQTQTQIPTSPLSCTIISYRIYVFLFRSLFCSLFVFISEFSLLVNFSPCFFVALSEFVTMLSRYPGALTQDWEPVVLHKNKTKVQDRDRKAVNQALWCGP